MCYYYTQLGTEERSEFLVYMATSLSIDHKAVQELIMHNPEVRGRLNVPYLDKVKWII